MEIGPCTRKRKSSSSNGKENSKKSARDAQDFSCNVRWDINTDSMSKIMMDMGVGILDIDSDSADSVIDLLTYCDRQVTEQKESGTAYEHSPAVMCSESKHDVYDPNNESSHCEIAGPSARSILTWKTRSVQRDHTSCIADEVILQIFRWLSKTMLARCAQTCKRWKRLAYDESLWRRLDLYRKKLNSGVVGCIIKRGVTVLRLAIAEISSPLFIDNSLTGNDRFCKLQVLDVSMAAIDVSGLCEITSVCNKLRKLSLENCQLSDDICSNISQNSRLQVLNMAMCSGLTCNGIEKLTTQCLKLVELNVGWTKLSEGAVECLVQNIPQSVKKLNISGLLSNLQDDGIDDLSVSCPDLIELDVSDCTELTEESIKCIVARMALLKSLSLSRCYSITPDYYLTLQKLNSLRRLEIHGILSEESLTILKRSLPDVKINVSYYSTIARPTTGVRYYSSIWDIRLSN